MHYSKVQSTGPSQRGGCGWQACKCLSWCVWENHVRSGRFRFRGKLFGLPGQNTKGADPDGLGSSRSCVAPSIYLGCDLIRMGT